MKLDARYSLSLVIENAEKLMKIASGRIDIDYVRIIDKETNITIERNRRFIGH